jgi:hypothetical protein
VVNFLPKSSKFGQDEEPLDLINALNKAAEALGDWAAEKNFNATANKLEEVGNCWPKYKGSPFGYRTTPPPPTRTEATTTTASPLKSG